MLTLAFNYTLVSPRSSSMYEAFYGLSEKPFSIRPDPTFLYLGKRHSLAYTMLEYGVEHGDGFTVITGEVGCGKTTLIRHLLNNLEQDVNVGLDLQYATGVRAAAQMGSAVVRPTLRCQRQGGAVRSAAALPDR